jgi:capsular exopolysaccharide synthesis family protein
LREQQDAHGLSLRAAVAVLRRRWHVALFCLIVVPALAYGLSKLQEKEYTASASLLFRDPALDQKLFGADFVAPAQDPNRAAATNAKLVSLKAVARRTARALAPPLSADEVARKVDVEAEGQADVVSVKATDPAPAFAARLANTFARQYIAFRREADRSKVKEAQDLVQRQLARLSPEDLAGQQGQTLRNRAQQLQILASLQTGNAELVQRAEVPTSPSSPKTFRNVAIGGFFGLLLALGLPLLLEKLDRRLRDPHEVEELFGRPILGVIPASRELEKAGPARLKHLPAREEEALSMLRANLRYFNVERPVKSVLVTSAAPGDGKSTVTWNLGAAAANAGADVLIIEADLRHPAMAAGAEHLRPRPGLSNLLSAQIDPSEAVQKVAIPHRFNVEPMSGRSAAPVRTMDVIVAGALPPNPVDLVESSRMREIIEEAARRYDLVLIDTPPTAVVSDAVPLVKEVDGVIVVTRLGKSTRESVHHLRNQLAHLGAPVLGIVVNALKRREAGYGYADTYGYGAPVAASDGTPGTPSPDSSFERQTEDVSAASGSRRFGLRRRR